MGWKFTSSFIVFLKVSTVSEKLISKLAQVSEDGMELALTGCSSGSRLVHKDSSSTTYATKRSRVKQPQKTMFSKEEKCWKAAFLCSFTLYSRKRAFLLLSLSTWQFFPILGWNKTVQHNVIDTDTTVMFPYNVTKT